MRAPEKGDVVTDAPGRVIGQIVPSTMEGSLVGQACIDRGTQRQEGELNVFSHPRREDWEKPYEELEVDGRPVVHSEATVVSRFMC